MNELCINLDFGIEPLQRIEDLNAIPKEIYMHRFPIFEFLNPRLIVFLTSLGLTVGSHAEVFYSAPNSNQQRHRDVPVILSEAIDPHDFVKLNYVYYGSDSTMNWYEVIDESLSAPYFNDYLGVPAHRYEPEALKLIHQQAVGFPSLVQVGVTHNVTTHNEERFCLCIVPMKDGKRIPMNQALEIFKEYIV